MKVIDPHVHLWDLETHRYPWMENTAESFAGDNASIKRTYLVEHLMADAGDAVEIEQIVHVEANHDPADPVEETRWLQSLAASAPRFPGGIVAYCDLSAPDAARVLEGHAQHPNLRGIRQILNVHASPFYDYVGRHYLREPQWRANFALLARHGLSFDLQLYPSQMAEAGALAREHPGIALIVNHTGMFVDRSSAAGWRAWRDGLRKLAACPNVAIKISGLGMFDHRWTVESLRPYALEAIDAFGCDRAMFASNFPVDKPYGSYAALWQAYAQIVADASEAERDALFRATARRVYRLG